MKKYLFLAALIAFAKLAQAQMAIGTDTLYGNEWIQNAQSYYKIRVSEDGMYRLSNSVLQAAGVPLSIVTGNRFRIYKLGQEIPIYTSTTGAFAATDYIDFYGQKNRSEVDAHLYKKKDDMLNPEYSNFTDTAVYFLTWNNASGKRFADQANDLSSPPARETWFWHTLKKVFNDYGAKPELGQAVYIPEFQVSEGFGTNYTKNFSTNFNPQFMATGVPATVSTRWAGNIKFHYTETSLNSIFLGRDTVFLGKDTTNGFAMRTKSYSVPAEKLSSSMNIRIYGSNDPLDARSVSIVALKYAHEFNFENKNYFEFTLDASATAKYLEIDNFASGGSNPILYDLTNNTRLVATVASGKIKILIPPSVLEHNLVLVSENSVKSIPQIQNTVFTDLTTDGGDYVIITSARFMGADVAKAYADYRATAQGGSFRPQIVDIQQLYEQFAYGVQRHPMAVRNFIHYIKKRWANPKHILLLGKALEYNRARIGVDFDIPTWSYPGSDLLFAASNASDVPIISIGRIAASTTNDVKIYLDKVKELEYNQQNAPQTLGGRDWMKNVMQLSGGGNEGPDIKIYMNQFANILNTGKWGANVTTFSKNTTDVVQVALNDLIFNRFNQGTSLINFFGHASFSLTDFDINTPELFTNKGKYPVFVALGCLTGNVHQTIPGLSESYIFYEKKGMSAFMGTSGESYLGSLQTFSSVFYNAISTTYYGKSIGEILVGTMATLGNTNTNTGLKSVMQEFLINGDPALKINVAPGPDFIPDATTLKFTPSVPNAQLDSFGVQFNVVNIGTNVNDSITISIQQQLPNGTKFPLLKRKILTPQYSTTFNASLPMVKNQQIVGPNRLLVKVDADNNVAETPAPTAEANNDMVSTDGDLGVGFYVLDNNAKAVYPTEFAIVNPNTSPIILKASSSNALAKVQNYIFEIDVDETFNTPAKQRTIVNQKGGIVKWQPNITWQDSTVYYWRVTVDSLTPAGFVWSNSSFVVLKNAVGTGWNQSHFDQLNKDKYTGILLNDKKNLEYAFGRSKIELKGSRPTLFIEGEFYGGNQYFPNGGLYVVIFDSLSGQPYRAYLDSMPFNPDYPGFRDRGIPHPLRYFVTTYAFNTADTSAKTGRKGFIDFINNDVPKNCPVLVFTVQQSASSSYFPQDWARDSIYFGTNIFQILERQGAKLIRQLPIKGSVPYMFAFQKDRNNVLTEQVTNSYAEAISDSFFVPKRGYRGNVESKIIGPSAKWQSLIVNCNLSFPNPETDSATFDVIGVAADKTTETTLLSNISAVNTDISTINAITYPHLKLRFNSRDSIYRTSPQLKYWRVLYAGVTELAVTPNIFYRMYNDTIQQGDTFKMDVAIENISDVNADSVAVKLTLTDEANVERVQQKKMAPLSKNANSNAQFTFDTRGFGGRQQVALEVNPKMAQPELYSFNNFLQTNFYIEKDRRNPLLDITFDGIRILNNDIVSSRPKIMIELRDENKFLALNDTALFKIYLENQNQKDKNVQLMMNDPNIRFIPAKLTGDKTNKATIEYSPTFTEDGAFRLVVRASDATGNSAGNVDYSVAFKVITKSSISNVLAYPNPFSDATRFVYTMTGSDAPQYFKVQIMTVAGKIVREITQDEIGPLKIGKHLTDYVWNGTDEYGDKLANGVYLYRIVAKKQDGKAYENFDTGTDQYFQNGLGKLVIMR